MFFSAVPVVLVLSFSATGHQLGEGEGYIRAIETPADFDKFSSAGSALPGVDRRTKIVVPAVDNDPSLLPTYFQNVNHHAFHFEFLRDEFPEKFAGLTAAQYLQIVEERSRRQYFACVLFRFKGVPASYGFDIFTRGGSPAELPRAEEVKWVFDRITPQFKLGVLPYAPLDPTAVKNAEGWENPGFPINFAFGGGIPDYIPYVRTENYGRVKIFTAEEFEAANDSGGFSSQDIVVLGFTPSDIEGVIAGAITETLQDPLGHLALRTARRGSPNARITNALELFRPYEGKLIRLKLETTKYIIEEATQTAAEAWWASHRPKLSDVPVADTEYSSLDAVWEVPLAGTVPLVTRYGGKASNFVRLYSLLDEEHRVPAMIVPFHYYQRFLEQNQTRSYKNPVLRVSFAKYIEELLADANFRTDSAKRFVELEKLRDLIEDDGLIETAVVQAIARRVEDVFKFTEKKVRFRSSSNIEDLLEFNGAGLYSSTSVCIADDLDDNTRGPSRCDADEENERGIARGLKRVWASLWNYRAFEERDYFQISHLQSRMAVLVSEGFPEELSNGVAFTGNPDDTTDKRYLITVQDGDTSIVFPEPGVLAEKNLLTVENGVVTTIIRLARSTLVPPGKQVLSDDQLRELGAAMARVEKGFDPFLELGTHSRAQVVLDFEFKFDLQGNLRFKQVRPFLIPTTESAAKNFVLRLPAAVEMCGSFVENRLLSDVLGQKMRVGLREGAHELRGDGTAEARFFEWLELSPTGGRFEPLGPGVWKAKLDLDDSRGPSYSFSTVQEVSNGTEIFSLTVESVNFLADGPEELTADPVALSWRISPINLTISSFRVNPLPQLERTPFLPCNLDHLPPWTVDFQLFDGSIHIDERFQDLEEGTGPAEIVRAEVSFGDERVVVEDYWRLCYTAGHHNDTPYPAYWILFEAPMEVPGVGPAHGIEIIQGTRLPHPPPPPEIYALAEDHTRLAPLDLVSFERLKEGYNPLLFRRGDVDYDGELRVTDAVLLLRFLFQGGFLPCHDAGDMDDLGSLDITDPILLLEFLFLGGNEPLPPYPDCGLDEIEDVMPVCAGPGCS